MRRLVLITGGAGLPSVSALLFLLTRLQAGDVRMVTTIFMFITLAHAWNVLGGQARYVNFGQIAFVGIGGYSTAVLMTRWGWPFWAAFPASGLCSAAFALLIGPPLLRLRGHYFCIATLGVAVAVREVVINMPSLTGGGAGIFFPVTSKDGMAAAHLDNDDFYKAFLFLAVASTVIAVIASQGMLGMALRAIGQDEDAAAALGVNVAWAKLAAFLVSAVLTALAGSLYALQQVAVYPQQLFDGEMMVIIMVMVLAGGCGTVSGPIVGAAGVHLLGEQLRLMFPNGHSMVLALCIILAVLLFPCGVVGLIGQAWRTRRVSLLTAVRTYRL